MLMSHRQLIVRKMGPRAAVHLCFIFFINCSKCQFAEVITTNIKQAKESFLGSSGTVFSNWGNKVQLENTQVNSKLQQKSIPTSATKLKVNAPKEKRQTEAEQGSEELKENIKELKEDISQEKLRESVTYTFGICRPILGG